MAEGGHTCAPHPFKGSLPQQVHNNILSGWVKVGFENQNKEKYKYNNHNNNFPNH